ncbi:MAG: hypothetical protein JWQ30_207 [Sediminibacterium sp.]|nr:hypothetical protein [Sediminibacterium sp.]
METFETTETKTGSIKTLSILTFIGSGLAICGALWNFFKADKAVADMEAARDNESTPGFIRDMMTPEAIANARTMAANKIPVVIISLIGAVLCIVGAAQMRKLKKQGYFLWLIGEILPFIGMMIFVNVAAVTSGMAAMIGIGIMLLFIILYTTQRKYLIY